MYNSGLLYSDNDTEDSYEYLEKAKRARSYEHCIEYLEKSLELDPNNIDARVMYLDTNMDISASEQLAQLEEIYSEFLHEYLIGDIGTNDNAWSYIEYRPYMRAVFKFGEVATQNRIYSDALDIYEFLLTISKGDNLGVRYKLAAIFVYLEEVSKLNALCKKYDKKNNDSILLLSRVMCALSQEDETTAKYYFERLRKANKHLDKFFKNRRFNENLDFNIYSYALGSKAELIVALEPYIMYLTGDSYYYDKLRQFYNNPSRVELEFAEKSNSRRPKLSVDIRSLVVFKGIESKYNVFAKEGLMTKEDFTKVTEEEVLAIRGIGPVTIKQLKANGVKFKK